MKLEVLATRLSGHAVETIEPSALATYPCPICRLEDAMQPLASVTAGGTASLESSFCTRCHHRFHRRFPKVDWLQDYYRRKFQSAPEELPASAHQPSIYRRLRGTAGDFMRRLRGVRVAHRVYDFSEGVLTGYGSYYTKDPAVRRILEVGCGYGNQLAFFRHKGFEVYGTESSPVRVAACRALGLDVRLSEIDGFREVEVLAPFDFIYSTHVLEHVIDVDSHVRALTQMLRDGGYLFFETPHLSGESLAYQSHTVYHVQTFSLRSMQLLLERNGLAPVRLMVDNNIRVLARKLRSPRIEESFFGAEHQPITLGAYPYLRAMLDDGPGEFTLRWDHYTVEVLRRGCGSSVYRGGLGSLQVLPGPHRHEIDIRVSDRPAPDEVFPVVFDHVGVANPPVWYKL